MPHSTKEQLEEEINSLKRIERQILSRGLFVEAQKLREAIDGLLIKLSAVSAAS